MTQIPFSKMSGSGNDFIIIDNRRGIIRSEDLARFAVRICQRKLSVGADGMILVEDADTADFRWRFINSDGSVAEMCGNGARCVARFAVMNGIAGEVMRFETMAGAINAHVKGEEVKIKMTAPHDLVLNAGLDIDGQIIEYSSINTGVPHVVIHSEDIDIAPVVPLGRRIRYHEDFAAVGTNVNFVSSLGEDGWAVRTYERGVEDETLACGTGNVAVALVLAARNAAQSPIKLKTRSGGYLKVYYSSTSDGFENVYLEGDARLIYTGTLYPDAWEYGSHPPTIDPE